MRDSGHTFRSQQFVQGADEFAEQSQQRNSERRGQAFQDAGQAIAQIPGQAMQQASQQIHLQRQAQEIQKAQQDIALEREQAEMAQAMDMLRRQKIAQEMQQAQAIMQMDQMRAQTSIALDQARISSIQAQEEERKHKQENDFFSRDRQMGLAAATLMTGKRYGAEKGRVVPVGDASEEEKKRAEKVLSSARTGYGGPTSDQRDAVELRRMADQLFDMGQEEAALSILKGLGAPVDVPAKATPTAETDWLAGRLKTSSIAENDVEGQKRIAAYIASILPGMEANYQRNQVKGREKQKSRTELVEELLQKLEEGTPESRDMRRWLREQAGLGAELAPGDARPIRPGGR